MTTSSSSTPTQAMETCGEPSAFSVTTWAIGPRSMRRRTALGMGMGTWYARVPKEPSGSPRRRPGAPSRAVGGAYPVPHDDRPRARCRLRRPRAVQQAGHARSATRSSHPDRPGGFVRVRLLEARRHGGQAAPDEVRIAYRRPHRAAVRSGRRRSSRSIPRRATSSTDLDAYEADVLVIALGADYDVAATPGLAEVGNEFYSVAGAFGLRDVLANFPAGTAIVGVCGTPFKCPPAPSEAALLLDDLLRSRGVRDDVRSRWPCRWPARSRRPRRRPRRSWRGSPSGTSGSSPVTWSPRSTRRRTTPSSTTARGSRSTCSSASPSIERRRSWWSPA